MKRTCSSMLSETAIMWLLVALMISHNHRVVAQSSPLSPVVLRHQVNDGAIQRSVVTNVAFLLSTNIHLAISNLAVRNIANGFIDPTNFALTYDAASNRATWTFPGLPGRTLPDGNFTVSLRANTATNSGGQRLDGNADGQPGDAYTFGIFRYAGDYNGDRDVDFLDNHWLQRSLELNAPTSLKGTFDFNGDGKVDANDLPAFAAHYFTVFPAQPGIFAALVNDTGSSPWDSVTADPTIAGTVVNTTLATRFLARFDDTNGAFFDVTTELDSRGSFWFTSNRLAQINGSGLADGSHTLYFRTLGGQGSVNAVFALPSILDTGAPDTFITSQPPSLSPSNTAVFTFAGLDALTAPSNLTFQCRLDGGAFSNCVSPFRFTSLSDGSHIFEVRAMDEQGHIDPSPATYTWIVDTSPPDTSISSGPPPLTNGTAATFTFTGIDNLTPPGQLLFECRLDGGAFAPCVSPQGFSNLTDGLHAFAVRAVDAAGHVDPTPAQVTWTVDTMTPAVTFVLDPLFDSPPTGDSATTNTIVTLAGQTEPSLAVTLTNLLLTPEQGGDWATAVADSTGHFSFTNVSLSLATNLFGATASDRAGNRGSTTLAVILTSTGSCLLTNSIVSNSPPNLPLAGGSGPSRDPISGSVVFENCEATMSEGDSFLVTLGQTFQVSSTASSLTFTYSQLAFDSATTNAIKDAFEVAIVDEGGVPLTYVIGEGRDACFNASDGQLPALANGVTLSSLGPQAATVRVSLASLPPGQRFRVIFRLVNNDRDHQTRVHISDVSVEESTFSVSNTGQRGT